MFVWQIEAAIRANGVPRAPASAHALMSTLADRLWLVPWPGGRGVARRSRGHEGAGGVGGQRGIKKRTGSAEGTARTADLLINLLNLNHFYLNHFF